MHSWVYLLVLCLVAIYLVIRYCTIKQVYKYYGCIVYKWLGHRPFKLENRVQLPMRCQNKAQALGCRQTRRSRMFASTARIKRQLQAVATFAGSGIASALPQLAKSTEDQFNGKTADFESARYRFKSYIPCQIYVLNKFVRVVENSYFFL